ncbi:hypothetical protein WR25_23244 [Diploscapter pachys]|uniref:Carboxypeptidase n=1 Tax=Diploscapter pachys TaxID=2018661 RepID=A0A2A2JHI7_9BILA|nr:hypothetical protein WR25_23244 [Diploscapter pachys]
MGPLRVMNFGKYVTRNSYTWNRYASIIYLDQPAGVGLSYRPDNQTGHSYTDGECADDNLEALRLWFDKFPERKTNEFYIMGESYAGVYIPMLGVRLLNASIANFKGVLIGNGLLDDQINFNTQIYYTYYHGLVDETLYQTTIDTCCQPQGANCDFYSIFRQNASECTDLVNQLSYAFYMAGLDPYFLYFSCYLDPSGNKSIVPDCSHHDDYINYLNDPTVRQALKIPPNVPTYESCNPYIENYYDQTDETHTVSQKDNVLALVKAGIRVGIFNGDVDAMCNVAQNSQFVRGLGLNLTMPAAYYTDETQLPDAIGMLTQYQGVDFLTIKGGGHFPASTNQKPKEALQVFVNFILQQNYSTTQPPDFPVWKSTPRMSLSIGTTFVMLITSFIFNQFFRL